MRSPQYSKAEKKASELITKLGYGEPPIDIVDVASSLSLNIFDIQLPRGFENVSGFIDFENKRIILNRFETQERKTFTTAHEIGHYLLHVEDIKTDPSLYNVLYRDTNLLDNGNALEKEANCFAASLLVPFNMLSKYADYPEAIIASIFQVSAQVIKYRLKDLNRNGRHR